MQRSAGGEVPAAWTEPTGRRRGGAGCRDGLPGGRLAELAARVGSGDDLLRRFTLHMRAVQHWPETLRTELTRCGIQVPSTPSCVKAIDLLRVNDFKSFVVPSERKERKKEKFSPWKKEGATMMW